MNWLVQSKLGINKIINLVQTKLRISSFVSLRSDTITIEAEAKKEICLLKLNIGNPCENC